MGTEEESFRKDLISMDSLDKTVKEESISYVSET